MALADLIIPGRIVAEMRSIDRIEALGELLDRLIASGAVAPDSRETALELLQNRRALRVEYAIVGLIVFEIFLTLLQWWLSGRVG